jgi:hypothetical protein
MPDKTVLYRNWKVVRFYRWKERLTLVQYFMLAGVAYLLTVAGLLAIVWWVVPHSWLPHPWVVWPIEAVPIALAMAAHQTWQRQRSATVRSR